MIEVLKIATNTRHMKDPFSNEGVSVREGRYAHWEKKGLLIFAIATIFSLGVATLFFIGTAYFKHKQVMQIQNQNVTIETREKSDNKTLAGGETLTTLQKIANVAHIEDKFTQNHSIEEQRKAHENAKDFLKKSLAEIGAQIDFISHTIKETPSLADVVIKDDLDSEVFGVQNTGSVGKDIRVSGQGSQDHLVVYGVASQFNGCEAPIKRTIQPGDAVRVYKSDGTQGPEAQLAFPPEQVELINCGGNLGFNGLCHLLNEETKGEVAHGYFTPSQQKKQMIIEQLRERGDRIEYPCIANKPLEGEKVVYQILSAAPAFGKYGNNQSAKGQDQDEIEFLCALHGYRAQFEKCLHLAQTNEKPVLFKAAAVGLGVFGNQSINVAKAFYRAGSE